MQKIIIGIIVVLAVVGIFALAPEPAPQATPVTNEQLQGGENTPMDQMDGVDVSGIHIMDDGTVMDGNGQPVPGAVIQADGTILLQDGRIVTPLADFRSQ